MKMKYEMEILNSACEKKTRLPNLQEINLQ